MIQKLKPACKDYLWGGTRLKEQYGKVSDMTPLAETWELSAHPDGESVVSGGEFDGLTFSQYIEKCGNQVLGTRAEAFAKFPVLIKFIDAKQALSIQVHPSDEFALEIEGEYGKTEMWYVMDCEEGAYLYFGVNQEISKEDFCRRINNNTVTEVLNKVPVKKGDVFFIESGTIHAIGAGILICEIQQNSNMTYRVYDYARRDAQGNLRELHIEKALAVSKLSPSQANQWDDTLHQSGDAKHKLLAECKYFTTEHYTCDGATTIEAKDETFVSLVILEGKGEIISQGEKISFQKGDSLFIPAGEGNVTIEGQCEWIQTTI
ncbi:type I phosphomannose isomerase catalytic subunit [Scatolibacter rhodanostii]|uniref:type I phosphomannose isomerase catalytic subunit n=1 Tax=Scatolibacter rhodanostii TaxID=2014781 RepID=UPI000C08495B|nr:type I phosphomannose isomerase catalytic subunit [Scatolibacter rhodanostii]